MFFTFPEDARWDAERQAVEIGVEIGEYRGVVRVPRRVFQRLLPERPTPERCVETYYLQRTRCESIAERKLRRRQLTEDGNVEISGRDLRKVTRWKPGDGRGACQIVPQRSFARRNCPPLSSPRLKAVVGARVDGTASKTS
jgi:Protein of unknown function (DUF1488)